MAEGTACLHSRHIYAPDTPQGDWASADHLQPAQPLCHAVTLLSVPDTCHEPRSAVFQAEAVVATNIRSELRQLGTALQKLAHTGAQQLLRAHTAAPRLLLAIWAADPSWPECMSYQNHSHCVLP